MKIKSEKNASKTKTTQNKIQKTTLYKMSENAWASS